MSTFGDPEEVPCILERVEEAMIELFAGQAVRLGTVTEDERLVVRCPESCLAPLWWFLLSPSGRRRQWRQGRLDGTVEHTDGTEVTVR